MSLLGDEEIRAALAHLPAWSREGDAIRREYVFDDFLGSVMFVNRVAGAAEAANHHPDVAISWSRVTVTLSTHSMGGVTRKDIDLAGAIDRLAR